MVRRIDWGDWLVPDDAIVAWGARLIVKQTGVDLVPDRQGGWSLADDEGQRRRFLELLNDRVPNRNLKAAISVALLSGKLKTRIDESTGWQLLGEETKLVLFDDGELTVVADTRASHGYCYVAAWVSSFRRPAREVMHAVPLSLNDVRLLMAALDDQEQNCSDSDEWTGWPVRARLEDALIALSMKEHA